MNAKQELFYTANMKVANALLTLGFVKLTTSRVTRGDGRESTEFWFDSSNAEGQSAQQIHHWMTKAGDDLIASEPERELVEQLTPAQEILFQKAVVVYLRNFAGNRDELISDIKNTPRMVEITNGTRSALIAENASDETKRKVAAML